MKLVRQHLISTGLALLVSAMALPALFSAPVLASEIKYVVNDIPITSYDIQRRAAFIRLQRGKGDASEQMIEQTLRMAEAKRLNVRITDQQVDDAYARFAKNNNMPLPQLDNILAQSGVTKQHFKDFIRAQMSWSQAIGMRSRSSGRMTEQEAVRKMLEKGGAKPSATEYMLQQVIFVVPAKERGKMASRKREAEAMRASLQWLRHDSPVCQGPPRRDGPRSWPGSGSGVAGRVGRIRSRKRAPAPQLASVKPSVASNSSAFAVRAKFPTIASRNWC